MNQEQKTIRVMGTGLVKTVPDTTRLRFSVDSVHDSYEEAYDEAAVGNKGRPNGERTSMFLSGSVWNKALLSNCR